MDCIVHGIKESTQLSDFHLLIHSRTQDPAGIAHACLPASQSQSYSLLCLGLALCPQGRSGCFSWVLFLSFLLP